MTDPVRAQKMEEKDLSANKAWIDTTGPRLLIYNDYLNSCKLLVKSTRAATSVYTQANVKCEPEMSGKVQECVGTTRSCSVLQSLHQ